MSKELQARLDAIDPAGFRKHLIGIHVRGIVDGRVVLRKWSKQKQDWRYSIEDRLWWRMRGKWTSEESP